ncbi:hypothetical protein [Desertivirga xinjiangensis]|uniref:hypothetical protein n=1 Tax=Desertivirga xinjiangensis TaxID=539206 RepID=UPI00210DEC51|nr:hypothetical protein [Pedobacter xinjiangensis]
MNLFKFSIPVLLILGYGKVCSAQKLPGDQEQAQWAPVPPKIDGKLSETESLTAYNRNTLLFYNMSNDAKNLYLVLKSEDPLNSNKILMGGITVSFNASAKKKEKDAASLTFPVIVRTPRGQGRGGSGPGGQRVWQGQNRENRTPADSAALVERRKQQLAQFKEIKVSGIPAITDSLVSIYNEFGIKTGVNFDTKGSFIYELAIPLELIGLKPGKEFAYNIKLNGRDFGVGGNIVVMGGGGGRGGNFGGSGGRPAFDPSMFAATDFWGKYTLADK